MQYFAYKIGRIHNSILYWMSAIDVKLLGGFLALLARFRLLKKINTV